MKNEEKPNHTVMENREYLTSEYLDSSNEICLSECVWILVTGFDEE